MKHSKADVRGKARTALEVRFEPQNLTSYSGLILFQHFFSLIGIKERLWGCFRHLKVSPIYSHHVIMMLLVVHLIIGHRRLRDVDYYRDDEMLKRLLGLKRLPDVSTISRSLRSADEVSIEKVRSESRNLVIERLSAEGLSRVTLDSDGSVLSTGRHAEGTAVGFNKKKKGARSYYPLFCTVAQTDQVLDILHRSGNVHDSNGADAFIGQCLQSVRSALPRIKAETRIDSAFFNETIAEQLHEARVEFTISVPFERFIELKGKIEGRKRWRRLNSELSFFETHWKPKSWTAPYRFVFIRKQVRCQDKAPVQLDLFKPTEYGYEFKVIVTNKCSSPRKVVAFHEGRGSQEGSLPNSSRIADGLRTRDHACRQSTVYVRRHSRAQPHPRITDSGGSPCSWNHGQTCRALGFREIETLRRTLIQRAGRIIRPAGKLILSMKSNEKLENELLHSLGLLKALGA